MMGEVNKKNVLTLHNKISSPNTATLLLVGAEGLGKHKFALSIMSQKAPFSLQIRTATSLPLPPDHDNTRPNIDYVIFILDLTNRMSISNVEASVKTLDCEYFLGRSCCVVLQANNPSLHGADIKNITGLCDAYHMPMFCASFDEEKDRKCISQKVLSMLQVACGTRKGVSPMLIDATRRSFAFEETL
ncbi:centromere protein M-like [Anneissia japonica]|uniref:centromere protein M-like n=1 Tax=Anneissia japonica TaxID=1529436 RepID=UPI001425AF93|nr:centromere protein M-like [Anneissia japonica]XP_033119010.1 centromere protein M-like [Anneissia japonica]